MKCNKYFPCVAQALSKQNIHILPTFKYKVVLFAVTGKKGLKRCHLESKGREVALGCFHF